MHTHQRVRLLRLIMIRQHQLGAVHRAKSGMLTAGFWSVGDKFRYRPNNG